MPSVSSTSARSSASRASATAAPRSARRGAGAPRQLTPGGAGVGAAAQLLLAAERGRAPRAGTPAARAVAARTVPTSRARARRRPRRPRGRRRAPGVGARAPVGEDAPRDHEPSSSSGRSSASSSSSSSLGQVELRLDVGLLAGRPDERASPFAPSRRPTACARIVLPAPGLARDRVQARRELELGLPDQDEVLDSQAAQHRGPS